MTGRPGVVRALLVLAVATVVAPVLVGASSPWGERAADARVELDLDGDALLDTATVVTRGDGSHSAVRICLSTRRTCDIVAETPASSSAFRLAWLAPECAPPRGDAPARAAHCTAADSLEVRIDGIERSIYRFDAEAGEYTRHWLEP